MMSLTQTAKKLRTTRRAILELLAAGSFPKPARYDRGKPRFWDRDVETFARNHQPENPNENRNPQT